MFAFLSKKIGIPNNIKVEFVSWNSEQGWIGVGGERGLLKILKLEDQKIRDGSAPTQTGALLLNQTLENHSGTVSKIDWNVRYQKLTSIDTNGLIIVWMIHNEQWFEEMINNRNKSFVSDIKWSPDGSKVCIAYDDGSVIVGGVEGSRLWGKDYPHRIAFMEWSPDCKMIIFGTIDGEVRVFDNSGMSLHQIKMACLQRLVEPTKLFSPNLPLAAIEWYNQAKMYTDDTPPGLCIAYQCGRIQLMRNEKDDDSILIDTVMQIHSVKWNPNGTVFAVSGQQNDNGEAKGIVQFYCNQGNHLKTLRIAVADNVGSISWEGNGLRLVMAVGSSIYFANIKVDHKWAYLSNNTLVFAYQKSDRVEYSIIFWDITSNKKTIKYVKNLQNIKSAGDMCCIITYIVSLDLWQIDLCNSIGSPIDQKQINIEPVSCTMTKTHIIVSSHDHLYTWQYKNQVERLTTFEQQSGLRRIGREQAWFIENSPDQNTIYDKDQYDVEPITDDIIVCTTANEHFLFVARSSGAVCQFAFPHFSLENKLCFQQRPLLMSANVNSTHIASIDLLGNLSILKINNQGGEILPFEKKDCWFVQYSMDIPNSFVFMEKSRMYVVNDLTPEEPIQTDGYIISYKDFVIKAAYLDDLVKSPDGVLNSEELILEIESNLLKEIKDQLHKKSMQEMFQIIKNHNHECLWRLYAKKALEVYDYDSAENAFVACQDYASLSFVKRIRDLDDRDKQKAEVSAYYGKIDEADEIYKKIERKDLSVQMSMRVGDWNKVIDQIKEGTGGQDQELQKAYLELGHDYSEQFIWDKAAECYELAKYNEGLIVCYTRMEDFEALEKIILQIPERSELLKNLGDVFQQMGLCEQAVKCYQKFGDLKMAVDCCVLLNNWNIAVDLAEQHNFVQIEPLLITYANQLLEKNKKLEAAELYRKAKRNTEAAKILSQIANDLIERDANPLNIKKMYVMAALEVDLYKKRMLDASMTGQGDSTAKTLNSLITSTINTSSADKILNNPWRGAEAWHFFILAQKQLYNGQFKYALKSSIRLAEYELDMDQRKIYSLIAIAAYYNKSFRECSRAFVKLQNLPELNQDEKELYENIAVAIFTRNQPQDGQCEYYPCSGKNCQEQVSEYDIHCKACGSNYSPCVASGRPIFVKEFYSCKGCRHKMIESEVQRLKLQHCALCHLHIDPKRFGVREAN